MAKKECPSCAMEIDTKCTVCPICGYEFPVRSKSFVIVAVILILVAIFYLIF